MNNPKNTRMCFVCRTRNEKNKLIRIIAENQELKIDQNQNNNSRAVYICNSEACIEKLCKRKNIEGMLRNSLRNKSINISIENLVNLLESQKRG